MMKNKMNYLGCSRINLYTTAFLFTCLFGFGSLQAQNYTVDDAWKDAQIYKLADKSAVAQQRTEWYRNARLGLFIHWNPSSVCGTEISWSKQFYKDTGERLEPNPRPNLSDARQHEHTEWLSWFKPAIPASVYDNLYISFYPGMFNADSIVNTAIKAGLKYIIMVAKHHDGFCMWNTRYTDFNIMSTPFHRDILGEMADACHRHHIKFGIYYSQRDWHHPMYSSATIKQYNEYMRNQIREILTKYKPISEIFFDAGEWSKSDSLLWEPEKMFKEIYALQPDIIINDRCGPVADYSTPEQNIGTIDMERTWESNMTFTGYWSWRGFSFPVISAEEYFRYVVSCAGGNGNLLMNVGIMPTGQIDPREQDRLLTVGKWLDTYGEAVYSTHGGPFRPCKMGISTRKGNNIYVIIFDWNAFNGTLPLESKLVKSVAVLGGSPLNFQRFKDAIRIDTSNITKSCFTVMQITLKKDAGKLPLRDFIQ